MAAWDVGHFDQANALIELASELEGEQGFPIGASEPNAAKNGEEWLLQRGDGRGRPAANRLPRAAQLDSDTAFDEEHGDESMDEDDYPPELEAAVNEAYGIQYRAKQKIEEASAILSKARPGRTQEGTGRADEDQPLPCLRTIWALVSRMPEQRQQRAGCEQRWGQCSSGVGGSDQRRTLGDHRGGRAAAE